MNRLKNSRCYLAGAMDRVADRGKGWREDITPFLEELGVRVFNPLHKPDGFAPEDEETHTIKRALKQIGKYDELSILMRQIRTADLRLVDKSDFLIVNLNLDIHPCGTYEEVFWANRSKTPILIHIEQGKHNTPDWLFGTIPHSMIFSQWDELKSYLNHIDKDQNIDTMKRWYFL